MSLLRLSLPYGLRLVIRDTESRPVSFAWLSSYLVAAVMDQFINLTDVSSYNASILSQPISKGPEYDPTLLNGSLRISDPL